MEPLRRNFRRHAESLTVLLAVSFVTRCSTYSASAIGPAAASDPAGGLQAEIDSAIARGAPSLPVPAGIYNFGNRTLLIENATDFTLLALGPVQLIFWQHRGGVVIRSCVNVTISGRNATGAGGIVIDRSPPPYAQAIVTKAGGGETPAEFELQGDSADPRTLSGALDPTDHWPHGYSSVMQHAYRKGSTGALPGSRGQPTSGLGNFDAHNMVTLGGGGRRFRCGSSSELGSAKAGDQFLLTLWKGYTYNIENSTRVTTEDLAILAAGYMGVYEADGGGGHVYRRFQLVPCMPHLARCQYRIISSNADGLHSEDVDIGPQIIESKFKSMLDDFLGIHATLLLVSHVDGRTLTVVHPHVSDLNTFGSTEHWYGTSEPMRRVVAGDALDLLDPTTFAVVGRAIASSGAVLLSPSTNDPTICVEGKDWGCNASRTANAIYPSCCTHFPTFEPEKYKVQHFATTVYQVELTAPPPRTKPFGPLQYVLQIAKTQSAGSVVQDSVFETSTGFFARWKSSNSVLTGNTFAESGQGLMEIQMLPSYFEGPAHLSNISITNNTFVGDPAGTTIGDILETKAVDAPCCSLAGLHQSGNTVVNAMPKPKPPTPPPPPPAPPPGPIVPVPGFSAFVGVDIAALDGSDDEAFGGLCTNMAVVGRPEIWKVPTALCDLLGCVRFGRFGGSGKPAGPPPADAGYCIKSWSTQRPPAGTVSYLSQTECGGGVKAQTINGSCNNPNVRYTVCPNGAGTLVPLQTLPAEATPAVGAKACAADQSCVGFVIGGGSATTLSYGLKGIGPYTGYASYIRIP